jgi:multiple sugar transport system ATP-binding protein
VSTVDLIGLRKSYGTAEILHGIDLAVAQGEFLALVGPSGCGKSTLLRMIAGLETVTGGEIRFDGRTVNTVDPKRRNVAMVFQNYALYPHMTVRENMGLNLRISGLSRAEIRRRVDEAAALLEVTPILDRRPSQLSGGQRQRVAMGRAIVRDPAVFLFDEPLSNLDAKLRVQMRAEIKALHRKVRTTAIYVTHDQIEAMTLADRIAVMNAGRIEQLGTPLELYQNPANRFVAGFIGSPAMNFLPGRIEGGRVRIDGSQVTLALTGRPAAPEGARVDVGLRPEHLRPAEAGLAGRVTQVEPTGSQTHLLVDFAGRGIVAVLEGMVPLSPDDEVTLAPAPEQVHLFAADSGEAIGTNDRNETNEGRNA